MACPASRLLGGTYAFSADERLSGRIRLSTLTTINGSFASSAEKDFFANVNVQRFVTILDGESTVLSLNETVASDSSGGNSDSASFLGETRNTTVDVDTFLTSQFAVSGHNDLVIRFDYVFSASAKGSLNNVLFSAAGGGGSFSIRNRSVTLQLDVSSLLHLG